MMAHTPGDMTILFNLALIVSNRSFVQIRHRSYEQEP